MSKARKGCHCDHFQYDKIICQHLVITYKHNIRK
ncbi:hypothetical protein [Ruminococcus albus]